MAKFEADCDTGSLLCAIVVMALPVLMYVMFGVVLIRDGYISAGLQCLGVAAAFAVLFYILVFKWDMIGDHARHWEKKLQPLVDRAEAFTWQQTDDHEHMYR
jgi:hypothetical protein